MALVPSVRATAGHASRLGVHLGELFDFDALADACAADSHYRIGAVRQAGFAVARQRPGATPWWRLKAAANENSVA
jgi:hypothetical protein